MIGVLRPDLLVGKAAVISGAANGIGAAAALEIAAAGADVLLLDVVAPDATVDAIRAAGGSARGLAVDIRDREGLSAAMATLDRLDILVTAAGIYGAPNSLEEIDVEEFDRVIDVNLKGTLWTIAAGLPLLRVRGGNIVAVGSAAGKIGGVIAGPHYVSSKGAIHAALKWVARTEAANGIVANGVAPGPIETAMISGRGYSPDSTTVGRIGTPSEVGGLIAFLASPGASYMTGAVVDVNGGLAMT
ncbi:SDR family NAD(P)-dependent oxidoreductase [Rhodococcus opacus]|jgi:3-oxoacyl-[acyl-carrier protein] reductase|uniref:SDR family NAD(P)-dependent oxidoreductase n=1 Tax=Rhodococcus opacus TaxID=37919 RepID=UPI0011417981|nr:SDR family oxidoreductase [Rhodococcus opacus]MDH6293258.1 3-oxoacyl-[acyl-carrier protein] reductase [Rhodococcus opacus]TQC43881.1 SDR family oxidoreductase [Rhodococcus sp. WS4]